jgi:hypothetical protein
MLTKTELFYAAVNGVIRNMEAKAAKRTHAHGLSQDAAQAWDMDIEGACGEMAVAKALDRYWAGSGTFRGGDVGELQVRTAREHRGRLILHESDADDQIFVLVTGRAPDLCVRGWLLARDGKRAEYWQDPGTGRPAFFVPQDALRPVGELGARV